MSPQKTSQYQAYSLATLTMAKTRQIVMLYDGAIRFLRQAQLAITEKRIEDRFRLLVRASDVIIGLQNSLDFKSGEEIAHVLHRFYTNISMRILSVNFNPKEAGALCEGIIGDLKQMRDVWDAIDNATNTSGENRNAVAAAASNAVISTENVTFSA